MPLSPHYVLVNVKRQSQECENGSNGAKKLSGLRRAEFKILLDCPSIALLHIGGQEFKIKNAEMPKSFLVVILLPGVIARLHFGG